jgi:hypothetical protein
MGEEEDVVTHCDAFFVVWLVVHLPSCLLIECASNGNQGRIPTVF